MNSKWHSTQLSSLLSGKPRNGLYKGAEYQGVGCRWIKMKDIYGSDFIKNQAMMLIDATPSEIERFGCKDGDLLFGRTSLTLEGIGDCALLCQPRDTPIFESNLFRVRFDQSKADPRFFYYFFKSPQGKELIQSIAKQTAATSITATDLIGLDVPCPNLAEQHKVSGFLQALDDRITLLRETNATLEAIAQALFKSWFVDFDPVRAKAEGLEPEGINAATAALFPDSFEESELGLLPSGWLVKPVGDAVECIGGGTPDTKNPSYWEPTEHAWTTPKDLSGLQSPVLLSTERKLSTLGLAKVSSGLLPAGTLLLSSRAPIGYLAIAQMPIAVNQGYIAIPSGGELSPLYMLFWCRQNMEGIKARANGSTFMEISKKAFRPIPTLVPSAKVLDAFANVADPLFERLIENERQAQTLTKLRDTLLPRLISGQLRLPEVQAQIEETCA